MRRFICAAAAAAFGCAASAGAADLRYDLTPTELASGVFMLAGKQEYFSRDNGGAIANIGIIVGSEGAILVDAGPSAAYGRQLKALAEKLAGKPVVMTILTHHHPDHILGGASLAGAPLAASAETAARIKTDGQSLTENMYRLAGDWMLGTEPPEPDVILGDETRVIGGRTLRFYSLPGHAPGDLAVLDPASGVLFAGDLVFNQRAPTTPDADLAQWRRSLAALRQIPFKILVPGHGPASTDDAPIRDVEDYLAWLDGVLRRAVADGSSMTEVMRTKAPDRFSGHALAVDEFRRSVVHLFPGLEVGLLPPAVQPKSNTAPQPKSLD